MRELTKEEFLGVQDRSYPSIKLHEDQWGEYGYFFDPVMRRYAAYSIDRKDQIDEVTRTFATAVEVLADCSAEQRAAVSAWLGGLST